MPNPTNSRLQPTAPPAANTIRLAGKDLERVLDDIDTQPPDGAGYKRTFVRWPFRHGGVRIEVLEGSRICSSLRYACRNISGGGMSVMHSAYVHPGTCCVAHLPKRDGDTLAVTGKVHRCRHFRGHIHEVGIRFDRTIDVGNFVDLDPFKSRFSLEHVDAAQLTGSVLHCDGAELDRKIFRHLLRDTQMNVVGVESAAEAMSRIKEGFDVVVIDMTLADGAGADLASNMRDEGFQQPIIITSADASPEQRASAKVNRASAFLSKPLDGPILFRALADLLLTRRHSLDGSGPIHCSLKSDDPARAMVPELVNQLQSVAKLLCAALDAGNIDELRNLCQRVKGSAPPLGFESVGNVADGALRSLLASMSVAESGPQVRALIAACARVKDDDARKAA